MDQQKQQLVEKLKSANNILVTVRTSPTVDALSAAIGLTLLLNKQGKHATAVYSGETPSTIEFLKPEKTLEKTTDSLRDFIIALDKSKADKLRYKVEDKIVKIFITPYRTSITENDLNFSQGDFNVDAVVAIGVHNQADIDQAVTAHGRILHDAVVMSLNNTADGKLGSINWQDLQASSLAELVAELTKELDTDKEKPLLDEQIATALLTGIVAETDRFSNEKTTSVTMGLSADLMKAGANQQLVATKLQEAKVPSPVSTTQATVPPAAGESARPTSEPPKRRNDDGTLEIAHERPHDAVLPPPADRREPLEPNAPRISGAHATGQPIFDEAAPAPELPSVPPAAEPTDSRTVLTEPPTMGGRLTANSQPESYDPTTDPFSTPDTTEPLLSHDSPTESSPGKSGVSAAPTASQKSAPATQGPKPGEPAPETLAELEDAVRKDEQPGPSPSSVPDLDSARDEVLKALSQSPEPVEPEAGLGAQPLGGELHPAGDSTVATEKVELEIDADGNLRAPTAPAAPPMNEAAPNAGSPADQPMDMPLPPTLEIPEPNLAPPTDSKNSSPNAPPPVPPPMMPPYPQ